MSFARTINPSLPGILPTLKDATAAEAECKPVRIRWKTTGPTRAAVRAAESRIADQVCRMRLATLEFGRFGKTGIVKRKCSPDGFVQLALQLAMWTVYGELVCTYETAMTKGFQHGRTEPIRAVRPETVAFVRAFDDLCGAEEPIEAWPVGGAAKPEAATPASTTPQDTAALMARAAAEHAGDPKAMAEAIAAIARSATGMASSASAAASAEAASASHAASSAGAAKQVASAFDRCAALRTALAAQVARTRTASAGVGGERHLFAMSSLASELGEKQPALFTTAAWSKLNESILSTSNCGNPSLRLFGFGNVADYGFGVGYLIKNDGLVFCISSQRRDARRFTLTLERALLRMAATLDEVEGVSA
jgi:carnitine O-acetyltransferase